jgi:beta-alanine--pyruvate transaminase
LATLQVCAEEELLTRAATLERSWEDAAHALQGTLHIIEIRNCGLVAAIELEPVRRPGAAPTKRSSAPSNPAFLIRVTGDITAMSSPVVVEKAQIDRMFDCVKQSVHAVD